MRSLRVKGLGALVVAALLMSLGVNAAQQSDVLGHWLGTWEGGGAGGRFELTIGKSGEALSGKVDVGQDTGDYTSPFSSAALEGGKFKARYDYPPEPQAEIVLEGSFEGAKGSGTWSMVQKGGTDSFAAGTWSVEKK